MPIPVPECDQSNLGVPFSFSLIWCCLSSTSTATSRGNRRGRLLQPPRHTRQLDNSQHKPPPNEAAIPSNFRLSLVQLSQAATTCAAQTICFPHLRPPVLGNTRWLVSKPQIINIPDCPSCSTGQFANSGPGLTPVSRRLRDTQPSNLPTGKTREKKPNQTSPKVDPRCLVQRPHLPAESRSFPPPTDCTLCSSQPPLLVLVRATSLTHRLLL